MNQRGHALFLALLLVLLLGALSALALTSARLRLAGGRSGTARSQVTLLAEGNVNWQVSRWDPLLAETIGVGGHALLPATLSASGMTVFDSLERLGQGLYLLQSTVERRSGAGALQASERTGQLVVRTAPRLRDDAGVIGSGAVSVATTAIVDGADFNPAPWGALCPTPAPPGPSLVLGPAGRLDPASCSGPPCMSGSPVVSMDSTVVASWLDSLGAVPLDSLVVHADQRLGGLVLGAGPAVRVDGSCDLVAPGNLGDPSGPLRPCGSYFPITVASAGTELRDGVGQGVLIGLGALTLSGVFQFTGGIVVLGPFTVQDQATLTGAVAAADSVTLRDASSIRRSTCAVRRVAAGAGRPFFQVERRWFRPP
ncbi:MAG: hypothetical protein ABI587_12580 [Gemmatimonadales bacterium]